MCEICHSLRLNDRNSAWCWFVEFEVVIKAAVFLHTSLGVMLHVH